MGITASTLTTRTVSRPTSWRDGGRHPAEPVSPDDDPVPSASSAPGARAAPCTTPEASAAPCASAAPGASAAGAAGVVRPLPPSSAMERVLKSLRYETLPVER